jgi:hypothetical protein
MLAYVGSLLARILGPIPCVLYCLMISLFAKISGLWCIVGLAHPSRFWTVCVLITRCPKRDTRWCGVRGRRLRHSFIFVSEVATV